MQANGKSRDAKGRFIPGHGVKSPGRPTQEVEKEFLAAFRRGCPPPALEAVTAKLVKLAIDGDTNAARLLLQHALPLAARVELMNAPPLEPYRVAGMAPEKTSEMMMKRIERQVLDQRKHAADMRKAYLAQG